MPVPGLLFNVFAFVVTLWLLVAGALLWRGPGYPVATRAAAAPAAAA